MELIKADYIGHRKRIKERYETGGIKGWHDYEILELALFYTIPRKDTKPIAKKLIEKYKTLNGVLNADKKELKEIKILTDHSISFINFLKDLIVLYLKQELHNSDLLASPDLVYNYLKANLNTVPNEEMQAIFLNNRNRLLSIEIIQKGTVNKAVIYPRTIVEKALYHHASSVIIAHNHPGGSIEPSPDDFEVTKSIKNALKTIEINLLDHIIIGGNNYFSFKEHGLEF